MRDWRDPVPFLFHFQTNDVIGLFHTSLINRTHGMNTLLVESEDKILSQLTHLINSYNSKNLNNLKIARNIIELSKHLSVEKKDDLIIADTELQDGSTFEFLNETSLDTPIIFISNQRNRVLESFKWNVIDYLIKPLNNVALINALRKYEKLVLKKDNEAFKSKFKKRFLVKLGDRMQIINVSEIAVFHTEGKLTYIISNTQGRTFLIDNSLEELDENLLDPVKFFRVNRQYIISIDEIHSIKSYYNRRLKVELKTPINDTIVVSRDRVSDFKKWLNQ